MAEFTHWKPMKTMPMDKYVIVHNSFLGHRIRMKTRAGDFYDENNDLDDSGIEWDYWTHLPDSPTEGT